MHSEELITNYTRHIEKKHPHTDEGQKLLSICDEDLKVCKLEKQITTEDLRKRGNDKWDAKCLQMRKKKILMRITSCRLYQIRRHTQCDITLPWFDKVITNKIAKNEFLPL